jgi:magnesium chelatase subunit D
MNPEEGELRPQLLDRFGLTVDVAASRDPRTRVEVVRRRLAYEADPAGFAAECQADERFLAQRILDAEKRLAQVLLTDEAVLQIAEICAAFDVDGMRGDLVTARAAIAHAAWSGRDVVNDEDVRVAARLALPHRRRRNPFDSPGAADQELEDILDRTTGQEGGPEDEPDPDGPQDDGPDGGGPGGGGGLEGTHDSGPAGEGNDEEREDNPGGGGPPEAPGTPYAARVLTVDRAGRGVSGRRSSAQTRLGRHLRGVPAADDRGHGLSVTATVHAAMSEQPARGRVVGGPIRLAPQDIRRSLRQGREGNLVVFVCDTSGSMGAARRMREVKTAVVSLLLDAYQRRDKVAVVTFARDRAQVVLPPTGSVELAQRRLADVATGGRTPLAEGLVVAADLVLRERTRDPQRRALVLLLTDGRATAGADAVPRALAAAGHVARQGIASVVVDCESTRGIRLRLARDVAAALGAEYLDLGEIAAGALSGLVRERGVA